LNTKKKLEETWSKCGNTLSLQKRKP
jgi:hypothetical protein